MSSALVIDDDPIVVKVIAHVLEEAGWEVFQAHSGDEGLKLAFKNEPDVVICDLLMPKVKALLNDYREKLASGEIKKVV